MSVVNPIRVGRFGVAFEMYNGDYALLRYLVRYNNWYMYVCSGGRRGGVDVTSCRRIDHIYVCGGVRVRYCVNSTVTSNIWVEAWVCTELTEDDARRLLSRCPWRERLRKPWLTYPEARRRRIIEQCAVWFRDTAVDDVTNLLVNEASAMLDNTRSWINTCYTMAAAFLDLLMDYVDEIMTLSDVDLTTLNHCRCTPDYRPVSCIRVRRLWQCP